ncbi:MAG TPA: zinc ribbon domain-containing protein [Isosphaeraceae bacterium]
MSEVMQGVSSAQPAAPATRPCSGCSAPIEPGDAFCPNCGAPQREPRAVPRDEVHPSAGFRCENCGAEVRCAPNSRSTTCPFCAAPYVVPIDPRVSGRHDPEFVIGFAVGREQAETIYRRWLQAGGLFRPSDLHRAAEPGELRGIYLPFWSFSMKAESRWSAEIGEHWYRTETYTERDARGKSVTRTRRVRETEWWPLEGGHHNYYSFYLVSGSKGLPQGISEWILPFQLLALKRYAPGYLAGWLSEEYSVEKDAARTLSEAEFRRRETEAVAAFLPGDTHRRLAVQTDFAQVNSDLILLPIYVRSYRYRGTLYRTLINGQTGKIAGRKPVSARRIAGAIGLVVLLGVLVYFLVLAVGR